MNEATPADFQRLLVAKLRAGGWTVEEIGPLQIRLAETGKESPGVFNLTTTYQQFRNGALVGHLADALVRTLHESTQTAPVVNELELERLMPLLKSRSLLNEVTKGKVEPIAWRPFITDDLIVTLVLDFPQSVRYVQQSEAEAT